MKFDKMISMKHNVPKKLYQFNYFGLINLKKLSICLINLFKVLKVQMNPTYQTAKFKLKNKNK